MSVFGTKACLELREMAPDAAKALAADLNNALAVLCVVQEEVQDPELEAGITHIAQLAKLLLKEPL